MIKNNAKTILSKFYPLLNRIKLNWNWKSSLLFLIILMGTLFCLNYAYAQGSGSSGGMLDDIVNGIMMAAAKIALGIAKIFMALAIFFLRFLIEVGFYNNYVDSYTVVVGWLMVRDIANMFFVVALLVIAFGTILGIEQYEWKKTLVTLIISAVLINFSKTICGLIIDVAHVFTVTFLNAVAAAAGGNLITMFKLQYIYKMAGEDLATGDMTLEILIGAFMGLFFAFLAMVTIGSYCLIMVIRMAVLWVLIILSPLAYILNSLPSTKQYAQEWWKEFTNYVIVAPLMVFFLWLSFATLGQGNAAQEINMNESLDVQEFKQALPKEVSASPKVSISEVSTWENMSSFFVAMAFLMLGLERAKKLGVMGGNFASSAGGAFKKFAMVAGGVMAAKWLLGQGKKGMKVVAKAGAMSVPMVGGKAWQRRGLALQDKGLQFAEKMNRWGPLKQLGWQYGKHEKIVKERKRVIEARQGEVSSSVKGSLLFGKTDVMTGEKVGRVEALKSYVNKLEGERDVTKGASEKKRTGEKAMFAELKLATNERVAKNFRQRTVYADTQQRRLQARQNKLILEVVMDSRKELPGKNYGADFISATADDDMSQMNLQKAKSERVDNEKLKRHLEAEEAMKPENIDSKLTGDAKEAAKARTAAVQRQQEIAAKEESAAKVVATSNKNKQDLLKEAEEKKKKVEQLTAEIANLQNSGDYKLTEDQIRETTRKIAELDRAGDETNDPELKKSYTEQIGQLRGKYHEKLSEPEMEKRQQEISQKEKEVGDLTTQIKKIEEQAAIAPEDINLTGVNAAKQLSVLEKIKECLEEKDEQKRGEKIDEYNRDTEFTSTFGAMYKGWQFKEDFLKLQEIKKLDDLIKAFTDKKDVDAYRVPDGNGKSKNSADLETIARTTGIVEQGRRGVIEKMSKDNPAVGVAFNTAWAQEATQFATQKEHENVETASQAAIYNGIGWTNLPIAVSQKTVEQESQNLNNVEREQLVQFFVQQGMIMAKKHERHEKEGAEYSEDEQLKDSMRGFALALQLKNNGYQDDAFEKLSNVLGVKSNDESTQPPWLKKFRGQLREYEKRAAKTGQLKGAMGNIANTIAGSGDNKKTLKEMLASVAKQMKLSTHEDVLRAAGDKAKHTDISYNISQLQMRDSNFQRGLLGLGMNAEQFNSLVMQLGSTDSGADTGINLQSKLGLR